MTHLVLVGLMGSGKSTVGRRIAERLGQPFVDLDDVIEARAGRPIPDIFGTEGEAGFRDHEAAALSEVLAEPEASVVATGGGAVLRPANREAMRAAGRVVWLRARTETLAERVGGGEGRPLLDGDVVERLDALALERADAYGEAAHDVVDVDDLTEDEVADRVLGN